MLAEITGEKFDYRFIDELVDKFNEILRYRIKRDMVQVETL